MNKVIFLNYTSIALWSCIQVLRILKYFLIYRNNYRQYVSKMSMCEVWTHGFTPVGSLKCIIQEILIFREVCIRSRMYFPFPGVLLCICQFFFHSLWKIGYSRIRLWDENASLVLKRTVLLLNYKKILWKNKTCSLHLSITLLNNYLVSTIPIVNSRSIFYTENDSVNCFLLARHNFKYW